MASENILICKIRLSFSVYTVQCTYVVCILSACLVIYRVFLMSRIEIHEISLIFPPLFFQKGFLFSMMLEEQKILLAT